MAAARELVGGRRGQKPALWTLAVFGLLGIGATLQCPTPLLVNLGAGDAAFTRGFRQGWERDGLQQTGETMFHWTQDGAQLRLPLAVRSGEPVVRLRLARFADSPTTVLIVAGGRIVDSWWQPPRGWRVRTVKLGRHRGPLVLEFRSESQGEDDLGIALDWVELDGVGTIQPDSQVLLGLGALIVGVPLLLALGCGSRAALCAALGLELTTMAALWVDRFGGLMAASRAGVPALFSVSFLFASLLALRRLAPRAYPRHVSVLGLPVAGTLLAMVGLLHPFYYYPDVDTHADYVAALRDQPALALDPTPFQERTGSWTRSIAGRRIHFPYAPSFHLVAVPLAEVLGDEGSVKTLAGASVGLTGLVVFGLATAIGLARRAAFTAQAVFLLLPVVSSRLSLALYPTLAAQSLEALALLVLLQGASKGLRGRRLLATAGLLLVVQGFYIGSLINVGALVAVLLVAALAGGDRKLGMTLLGLYVVTAGLVVAVLYSRFLPTFWRDVLPHVSEVRSTTSGPGPHALLAAWGRIELFYAPPHLLLAVLGLGLLARSVGARGRGVVAAALGAGLGLLMLRFVLPPVFRDVKEVELMAAPAAVLAAGGASWLARRRLGGWLLSLVLLAWALAWGVERAVAVYGDRFLAVGR